MLQGDSCPTEADPGTKDSTEHEKSRHFERKTTSSCVATLTQSQAKAHALLP